MAMLNGSQGAVSQINVTPLIDVLLVLLIIFMVIVPKAPSGLNAALPQPASHATADGGDAAIVVQVQADAMGAPRYRINSMEMAKSALQPKLAAILAMRREKLLFVKGDPKLPYAAVTEVVDMGRRAGAEQVAMLTPGSEMAR